MEIANMFDFINPTTIRIKGTRVGIEIVIEQFLKGADPREIQRLYPNLTLEQIYVTITYYNPSCHLFANVLVGGVSNPDFNRKQQNQRKILVFSVKIVSDCSKY